MIHIIIYITLIAIICILIYFYRALRFDRDYLMQDYENIHKRINKLESRINITENELLLDKESISSLLSFFEGKESFKVYKVTLSENYGDIAIVTTNKIHNGSYTRFELFSLRFGGIVSYCDVGFGGFNLFSTSPAGHNPIRGHKNPEYIKLGFGTIIMTRIFEYCSGNGETELKDVMIMPRNDEHDKRLKSFFKKNGFSNPDGRRIVRVLSNNTFSNPGKM